MGATSNNPTLSFSRDALRAIDRDAVDTFGIPSIVLMENAARGAATLIHDRCNEQAVEITIVCGGGNNGGDGYGVARHLLNLGHGIMILQMKRPTTEDASTNEKISRSMDIPIHDWSTNSLGDPSLLVDAIFGTGLHSTVEGIYADAINEINAFDRTCISLDIPSGLDCDDGTPHGCCVKANETITFVGLKMGFMRDHSRKFTGNVSVVDIGCPELLLEKYGVPASEYDE